jgi:hypothetical protein
VLFVHTRFHTSRTGLSVEDTMVLETGACITFAGRVIGDG